MRRVSLFFLIAINSAYTLLAAAPPPGSKDHCDDLLVNARSAFDRGSLQEAAAMFDQLGHDCRAITVIGGHRLAFYAGLCRQLLAESEDLASPRRKQLLAEAVIKYREVVGSGTSPDRAAFLNLAEAQAELGQNDIALNNFEKALAAGGADVPWYEASYGRFLVRISRSADAARYLNDAAKADPSLLEAQAGLVELALKESGGDAALWQLQRSAQAATGRQWWIALDVFDAPGWSDLQKRSLLATAVALMATDRNLESPNGMRVCVEKLKRYVSDPILGAMVSDLASALSLEDTSLKSWRGLILSERKEDQDLWRSLRSLLLARGKAASGRADYVNAEAWFMAVVHLEADRLTSEPIIGLVEMFAAAGDPSDFLAIADRYDEFMSVTPGNAGIELLRQRYDYHREFATLAAQFLKPDSNTAPYTARMAQLILAELEKAKAAAGLHNRLLTDAGVATGRIRLDAAAFDIAALAHETLGNPSGTVQARLDAAEAFIATGKKRSAMLQLQSLTRNAVYDSLMSSSDHERYQKLMRGAAGVDVK